MSKSARLTTMLTLVWILSWFGSSPRFVLGVHNSTCLAKFLQDNCGTPADYTSCCSITAQGTQSSNSQDCICNTFNVDAGFLVQSVTYCTSYVDTIVQSCDGDSTSSFTPDSTPSSTPDNSSTNSPDSSSVKNSPPLTSSGKGNHTVITAVVVSVVITILVIIIIGGISIFCFCKRRENTRPNTSLHHPYNPHIYNEVEVIKPQQGLSSHSSVSSNVPPVATIPVSTASQQSSSVSINNGGFKTDEPLQYELATLQAATDNFSDDNIIGRGGFGYVYKGTLLDGRKIAVKRLSKESSQGDTQFRAEIELLARLQHRNLVQLLGFCFKEHEALLVYEFMPNKSLDYFLFDDAKREELRWPIRFQIIKGIARGLVYLHDDCRECTIHRDLKAPNILLDAKMNPKIADFGLARICALEQTHVYTRNVAGTGDYIAPEYRYRGQFSTKSDVYAFGALVLEIISGRSIGSQTGELAENLMGFALRCWMEGNPMALMDPMLRGSFARDEVEKCIHLALRCVDDDVDKRPDMSTVVHKLNSKTEVGTPRQGFVYNSSSDQSTTTSKTSQSGTSSSISDGSFLAWPQRN